MTTTTKTERFGALVFVVILVPLWAIATAVAILGLSGHTQPTVLTFISTLFGGVMAAIGYTFLKALIGRHRNG